MKNSGFTLRKRLRSFRYAGAGIRRLLREDNARIHAAAAVVAVALGAWLGLSLTEWAAVVLCIGMVLAAEAVNSAIESLCDLVSPGYDEHIKHAKDLAAGAVLLLAAAAAAVGALVFLPKLFRLIS